MPDKRLLIAIVTSEERRKRVEWECRDILKQNFGNDPKSGPLLVWVTAWSAGYPISFQDGKIEQFGFNLPSQGWQVIPAYAAPSPGDVFITRTTTGILRDIGFVSRVHMTIKENKPWVESDWFEGWSSEGYCKRWVNGTPDLEQSPVLHYVRPFG
jgi:hypothetical protein